jgi:hypothetical protein
MRGGGASERVTHMGRIRSIAGQSPAIVISVLALALSLGGGAYASTQLAGHSQSPSVTSGVSRTSLTLLNGWHSANFQDASGNPKVAIQSNIVYLSGSLVQATPGNNIFAVLPTAFRPTHNMWITVYTYNDTSGTLYIGHDGTMEAYSTGTCGSGNTAQCYASLAGVSYPINS